MMGCQSLLILFSCINIVGESRYKLEEYSWSLGGVVDEGLTVLRGMIAETSAPTNRSECIRNKNNKVFPLFGMDTSPKDMILDRKPCVFPINQLQR